ncbi:hypothetical protein LTR37_009575 [Vermiconidia calcicola]|uniref:Uncharacterized protein n=1 Tax=Vermiconidia calcicola TaxID=1690605 RepID=A0ACC3N7F9_9PEZI|nr:hypothetical protein LTR37_009575 [Vermiconidia calcicola]
MASYNRSAYRRLEGLPETRTDSGATQHPDRPGSGNLSQGNGWLRHLKDITGLATQASRNPDFLEDSQFALDIFRKAHAMTKPWLDEVGEGLRRAGLFDTDDRGRIHQSRQKMLVKFASMAWNASKSRNGESHPWRAKMLKEMYVLLTEHLDDAEVEIRRLEEKLARKERRRGRRGHRQRNQGTMWGDDDQEDVLHGSQLVLHPPEAITTVQDRGPISSERTYRGRSTTRADEVQAAHGSDGHTSAANQHALSSITESNQRPTIDVAPVLGHASAQRGSPASTKQGRRDRPPPSIREEQQVSADQVPESQESTARTNQVLIDIASLHLRPPDDLDPTEGSASARDRGPPSNRHPRRPRTSSKPREEPDRQGLAREASTAHSHVASSVAERPHSTTSSNHAIRVGGDGIATYHSPLCTREGVQGHARRSKGGGRDVPVHVVPQRQVSVADGAGRTSMAGSIHLNPSTKTVHSMAKSQSSSKHRGAAGNGHLCPPPLGRPYPLSEQQQHHTQLGSAPPSSAALDGAAYHSVPNIEATERPPMAETPSLVPRPIGHPRHGYQGGNGFLEQHLEHVGFTQRGDQVQNRYSLRSNGVPRQELAGKQRNDKQAAQLSRQSGLPNAGGDSRQTRAPSVSSHGSSGATIGSSPNSLAVTEGRVRRAEAYRRSKPRNLFVHQPPGPVLSSVGPSARAHSSPNDYQAVQNPPNVLSNSSGDHLNHCRSNVSENVVQHLPAEMAYNNEQSRQMPEPSLAAASDYSRQTRAPTVSSRVGSGATTYHPPCSPVPMEQPDRLAEPPTASQRPSGNGNGARQKQPRRSKALGMGIQVRRLTGKFEDLSRGTVHDRIDQSTDEQVPVPNDSLSQETPASGTKEDQGTIRPQARSNASGLLRQRTKLSNVLCDATIVVLRPGAEPQYFVSTNAAPQQGLVQDTSDPVLRRRPALGRAYGSSSQAAGTQVRDSEPGLRSSGPISGPPLSDRHMSWQKRPKTPYIARDARVLQNTTKDLNTFIRGGG